MKALWRDVTLMVKKHPVNIWVRLESAERASHCGTDLRDKLMSNTTTAVHLCAVSFMHGRWCVLC